MSQGDRAAERFARYCELRDAGMRAADAGCAIGIKSWERYERSYREAKGQPRRLPGSPDRQRGDGMMPGFFRGD